METKSTAEMLAEVAGRNKDWLIMWWPTDRRELRIPVIPDIHQKVLAAVERPGALEQSNWHQACGTAHCRAGWVVTLAGSIGAALERRVGAGLAAQLIYLASDPSIDVCDLNFYGSNEQTMVEIRDAAAQR